MSSASAGGVADNTDDKNFSKATGETCPECGSRQGFSSVSTTSAEAQQGDGPAAASASASAVSDGQASTHTVSTCVGSDYAAAACDFGVVVVGPNAAAAASEVGVVAVAPEGAAATSNAANASSVVVADNELRQDDQVVSRHVTPSKHGARKKSARDGTSRKKSTARKAKK